MTVSKFTQPSYPSDGGANYPVNIDAAIAAMAEVAANFAPHEATTPDMTVIIDAGKLMNAGTLITQTQQTTTTFTAPVTDPRIDRIAIDTDTGLYTIIAGTEAASPVAPDYSSNHYPVCQILLTVGMTEIANSDITSERPLINVPATSQIFRGAGVYKNGSLNYSSSTLTPIPCDLELFDTDNIHDNIINNERLTVPSGVTKVKLRGFVEHDQVSVGEYTSMYLKKNNTGFSPNLSIYSLTKYQIVASEKNRLEINTDILNVTGGDFFHLELFSNNSTPDISNGAIYFEMEIIE